MNFVTIIAIKRQKTIANETPVENLKIEHANENGSVAQIRLRYFKFH